jgi:Alpha/beta hydrolase family
MTTFVLIAGGHHNDWCWTRLVPELEGRGHRTVAARLPTADPAAGLESYARAAAEETLVPGREPDPDIILVGHSLAGAYLPLAAGLVPGSRMVFLCAIVPETGRSVIDARAANPDDPTFGAEAIDEQGRLRPPSVETARQTLYGDCDKATVAWATARLEPQGLTVMTQPFPAGGWPLGLQAAYVCCSKDRWVPPEQARQMAGAQLGATPVELPGSHSPFLSRPAELAEVLHRLAVSEMPAWA